MRAAANSIANGTPSSRRQISVTTAELSSATTNSGRASRARSVNNTTASSTSDNDGTRHVTSPASPIGSRLVANSVTFGQVPTNV